MAGVKIMKFVKFAIFAKLVVRLLRLNHSLIKNYILALI